MYAKEKSALENTPKRAEGELPGRKQELSWYFSGYVAADTLCLNKYTKYT